MNSLLQKLEGNRTAILLSEIGVWLHLLGKLSEEFIQAQSNQDGSFGYRQICNNNLLQLDTTFFQLINDNWVQAVFNSLNNAILNIPQSNRSPNSLCEFVNNHLKRNLNNFQDCALLKIIAVTHDISGAEEKDLPWQPSDTKNKTKQTTKNNTFLSTAFGFEDQAILAKANLKVIRDNLIRNICPILDYMRNNPSTLDEIYWQENYPKLLNEFSEAYRVTVGDTQRPVNDVTLWDAISLASALFKSALAKMILEGWTEPININTKDVLIAWKILRVNFDPLSIMAKGVKIGDILGYRKAIEDSSSECKKIIEIKYCLGNEIYHDETGLYFSFPDVDAVTLGFWNDLINELKEVIRKTEPELSPYIVVSNPIPDFKDLTSQRVSAVEDIIFPYRDGDLYQDFSNLWSNVSINSEVCPVCRLRPMKENSDGCKRCLKRRKGRAGEWIRDPQNTIWLDEVSDHNDRVALLVGSFSLMDWLNGKLIPTLAKKTPSSGRVRRCWETTHEFIKSKVFAILSNFTYGKESTKLELRNKRIQFKINQNPNILKGATCDIDLEGVRFSPVCIDENSGTFVSTINLQILEKWGDNVNQIASYIENKKIKIKTENSNGWQGNFTISNAKPADKKFQNYLSYVQVYDSPDQFMVLVPAYDVLDIARRIVEEYEIQFSKVRDKLPFHIGIIAFHRRTALYAIMDAGKRLIGSFKTKTNSINAKIDSIQDITDNKLGNKVKKLILQVDSSTEPYSSVPLTWTVSYATGDPQQDDEWHPYFRFNGSNPDRGNYSFDCDGNGHYVVHVKELRLNDCVNIESSYFKLAYLDNAAERFRIGDELRPLDDIKRLDELWNDIKTILDSKNLGISQLYAYWYEVKKRYEDYNGDPTWEKFIKSSLTNILQISPEKDRELFDKSFQATKVGLLDLCLRWHLQVRKIKPQRSGVEHEG